MTATIGQVSYFSSSDISLDVAESVAKAPYWFNLIAQFHGLNLREILTF